MASAGAPQQVSRGSIVRGVDDDVILRDQLQSIDGRQALEVRNHLAGEAAAVSKEGRGGPLPQRSGGCGNGSSSTPPLPARRTSMLLLSARQASAADSALCRPTPASLWMTCVEQGAGALLPLPPGRREAAAQPHALHSHPLTCRWMLLSSTASLSTMPSRPTPAAARYSAAGEPRPPAPTTSAEPLHSRAWAA